MNELMEVQVPAETSLQAAYTAALEGFFLNPCESSLRSGYELGRQAITEGVGVMEMAAIHHAALAKVLPHSGPGRFEGRLRQAEEFFAESLSPYEMTHRGYREATTVLRTVNETMELEIQRIAHALHDEAGQLLIAAQIAIAELARDVAPDIQNRLQGVTAILNQTELELRRLSHELRPLILDDLGLLPAVHFLADGISKRSKLAIHIRGSLGRRFHSSIEIALYRIIQEALNNASKHAQAKNVTIQVHHDGQNLYCMIEDDGKGFDVTAFRTHRGRMGLGLVGIRERIHALGGMLQVNSQLAQGTSLSVTIPIER